MPATTFSNRDVHILRRLAQRVAELAALPREEEKKQLWYAHNALQPTRPLVFCDPENGWHEIIRADHLECEHPQAREWEFRLRQEIFWGQDMQDDRVISPYFDVSHIYTQSGWGLQPAYKGGDQGGAYVWDAPLKDYAEISKLHFPEITIHPAETDQLLSLAQEVFDGILTVRLITRWWWSLGMTRTLVDLRGLEQMLYDMIDAPDGLHRLMAFLRDGHLALLDWLEENRLLFLNNDGAYVGSGGFGWTHELPQPDFNGLVRTRDMWGFAESQETVGVSPRMFEAFVFQYQLPILERFGLNCYGCCEPLDTRFHIIERIPRLRRVSMSPWVNIPRMAERLGDRFIFSMKPNPADLAAPNFDEERIRQELRQALRHTRDCRVEIIMKDNHTIANDPTRVIRWVKIAREEAEAR